MSSTQSTWTLYKRTGQWDDVIEGPDADGVEVVALDDSFTGLVKTARLILDRHYPEDVFTGRSLDSGGQFVAKLREALRILVHADD